MITDITFNKNNTYIYRDGNNYIVQLVNDSPVGLSPKECVANFMSHSYYAEAQRRKGKGGNIKIFVVEKLLKLGETA